MDVSRKTCPSCTESSAPRLGRRAILHERNPMPGHAAKIRPDLALSMCVRLSQVNSITLPSSLFKHGDPSTATTQEYLSKLLDSGPSSFLERYGKHLEKEELSCFACLSHDYEVAFWLKQLQAVQPAGPGQLCTAAKNRRLAAMQQLHEAGEYFSVEAMQSRDPLMYEQYIGQYMEEEEGRKELLSEALIRQHERAELRARMLQQQEQEDEQLSEHESDEEIEEEDGEGQHISTQPAAPMVIEVEGAQQQEPSRQQQQPIRQQQQAPGRQEQQQQPRQQAQEQQQAAAEPGRVPARGPAIRGIHAGGRIGGHSGVGLRKPGAGGQAAAAAGASSSSVVPEAAARAAAAGPAAAAAAAAGIARAAAAAAAGTAGGLSASAGRPGSTPAGSTNPGSTRAGPPRASLSAAELEDKQRQFVQEMENRFLSGQDSAYVDYPQIDANEQLDDHWLDLRSRDAEDVYFGQGFDQGPAEGCTGCTAGDDGGSTGGGPGFLDVDMAVVEEQGEGEEEGLEEWERMAIQYASQAGSV